MMNCKLCQLNRKLQRSHIIPEFLHEPLYDNKHRAHIIEVGNINPNYFVQKGIREHLLCFDCEQHLNDSYEKPFKQFWIDNRALPDFNKGDLFIMSGIDYPVFKLFHLSVLFRAGIAADAHFSHVKLGPHTELIRRMMLNGNCGKDHQYHIFCFALTDDNGNVVRDLIVQPLQIKLYGHKVYMFIFGGCIWFYAVSSHASKEIAEIALKRNGTLPIAAMCWQNFPPLQAFMK